MIEHWKTLVGERSEAVPNVVEKEAVRKFAEAIGDENPLYLDEATAEKSRHGSLIAPPTFPRTFEYGKIAGMYWPESGMIHGEHRIRYERPLRVGEEVRCYTVFEDYREKEGRGGLLSFLTLKRFGESPSGERIFVFEDVAIVTPALRESLTA